MDYLDGLLSDFNDVQRRRQRLNNLVGLGSLIDSQSVEHSRASNLELGVISRVLDGDALDVISAAGGQKVPDAGESLLS